MIHEFNAPMTLRTAAGTITFNDVDGFGDPVFPRWSLAVDACKAGWQTRFTQDNMPGGDGSLLGKGFATGIELQMAAEPWEAFEQPACGALLTEMMDELRGHLWSLLKDTTEVGRLTYTPEGLANRMVDALQLSADIDEIAGTLDNVRSRLSWRLDSPFPYIMREEQTLEVIDTTTDVISMIGTAWFMPVVKVYGPFSTFSISHDGLDVVVLYDDSRNGAPTIGGGDYLEIDFFRNTAFKNGDGADGMPGIVLESSDFFPLLPGANTITTDCDARFLVNQAWA